MLKINLLWQVGAVSLLTLTSIPSIVRANDVNSLMSMSFDDLQEVEVTSVSRRSESRFRAAAAVSVISNEDIKRSGATNIADALRLVPGINVARIDSNKWAISARGFNRQFSNKLLILMDGRSVYTPLFSGVYWDAQDTVLEDIERIEVIRGPGATMWGANAVNGIINIITKNAAETQGNYLSATYGNHERGTVEARHGGELDEDTNYRIFGKFFARDESRNSETQEGNQDQWYQRRAGFRVDRKNGYDNEIRFQGDIYKGESSQKGLFPGYETLGTVTERDNDERYGGGSFLTSWHYTPDVTSEHTLQAYIDYHNRKDKNMLSWKRATLDIDYQNRFLFNERNEFIWGLNYRFLMDDLDDFMAPNGQEYLSYEPNSQKNNLYSFFLQNQYEVMPDKLFFTLGSKFEYHYYTDWEIQPNARIAWYPTEDQTVWASVSRASRTPTRGEVSLSSIASSAGGGFIRLSADSDEDFDSEKVTAYEIGYRNRPTHWTSFDISTFYNAYDNLRAFQRGTSGYSNPNTLVEYVARNLGSGEAYGFEVENETNITPDWSVTTGYSFIEIHTEVNKGSTASLDSEEMDTPKNQLAL